MKKTEQKDNVVDIATKSSAAAQSLKAQLEAEQATQRDAFGKELEALMAQYSCALLPVFKIGEQEAPVAAIVSFPVNIKVISQ